MSINVNPYYLTAFLALTHAAAWFVARGLKRNGNADVEAPPTPREGWWRHANERADDFGAHQIGSPPGLTKRQYHKWADIKARRDAHRGVKPAKVDPADDLEAYMAVVPEDEK